MDYIEIVVKGYLEHRSYLSKYLVAEQQKAEKEKGVDHHVFFRECSKVAETIKKEIDDQFLKKKKQLELLLEEALDKRDVGLIIHYDQELKSLEKDNTKEKFSASFPALAEGSNKIYLSNVRDIEDHIRWAKTEVYDAKTATEVNEVFKEKAKQEELKDLHAHIFKKNGFAVFEQYHAYKDVTGQSRTDLRAIYEFLNKDGYLVDTVELKHYINWLNKTYEYSLVELKTIDLNSAPNLQRKKDYQTCKEKANQK